jgi:hypothetical protein
MVRLLVGIIPYPSYAPTARLVHYSAFSDTIVVVLPTAGTAWPNPKRC